MSYRQAISVSAPTMPSGGSESVQVLGNWGPHRESSITDTDGSTVTTRNDTWTVSLGATPADLTTTKVADTATQLLVPGAIYEMTIAGCRLGYAAFFNLEWTSKGGGNDPAPGTGDWAWPFCNVPQYVFVAKEGQERLSIKLNRNGDAIASIFGSVENYVQVRRMT